MDKLEQYRNYIQQFLGYYRSLRQDDPDVESQIINDKENDRYLIVNVGWRNKRRIYGCVMHLDLRGDKIWIQYNGTEIDVAERFVEMGVPRQDIVIGFLSPKMRRFSDYAIA